MGSNLPLAAQGMEVRYGPREVVRSATGQWPRVTSGPRLIKLMRRLAPIFSASSASLSLAYAENAAHNRRT
jgi:hypothetical protein